MVFPFQNKGVIIGKHWFCEVNVVEPVLFEYYRGLNRNGLSVEDVFDVIDAKGVVGDGMFDGVGKSRQSEDFLETDELLSVFSDIALVLCQFFEIVFDGFSHGHQDGDFF